MRALSAKEARERFGWPALSRDEFSFAELDRLQALADKPNIPCDDRAAIQATLAEKNRQLVAALRAPVPGGP